MGDNSFVAILIVFICGLFFAFGFGAGTSNYKGDAFDCTNTCSGKHSIYHDNACYCKIGE